MYGAHFALHGQKGTYGGPSPPYFWNVEARRYGDRQLGTEFFITTNAMHIVNIVGTINGNRSTVYGNTRGLALYPQGHVRQIGPWHFETF